ncbi:hypothetical protein [Paenarthrobacter ilicis]|uniref:hypothetical protein n=1 Tax=Paenarthrobacter ilicis TaxID=43665 RepID=UPI0028D50281|nr:hypothetical protein [Paenarthrobacter ilicis]
MTQTLKNKIPVPTNGDEYNLTADLATAFNGANVVIPIASAAARTTLTGLGLMVGQCIIRTDLPGQPIETWNGTKWLDYSSGNITLNSSGVYQAFGGGYGNPGYEKLPTGRATLLGMIGTTATTITMLAGTGYLLGTIPNAVAPDADELYSPGTSSAMGKCTLYVRSNGNLIFESASGFSNIPKAQFFIGIGGINWRSKP